MPAQDDAWVERLARLFAEHPAWQDAARRVSQDSTSTVYFRHLPGRVWHLERHGGRTHLRPGAAPDPDLVFRFSSGAIERLESVSDGMGQFAVTLFELMGSDDPETRVDLRIVAGFPRLVQRGYVKLLLAAGPRVLAFGYAQGVATLNALERLVSELRSSEPREWERKRKERSDEEPDAGD